MFHHDARHTGCSASAMSNPDSLTLLWSYSIPGPNLEPIAIHSSPAVVDGRVYFVARDRMLRCLSASTGSLIWQRPLGGIWWLPSPGYEWLDSSPTVADEKVFVGSRDGQCYAFDAADGTPLWTVEPDGFPIVSSPLWDKGKVIFGSDMGMLYSADAATGNILASIYLGGGQIWSSPALVNIYTVPPSTAYLIGCGNVVYWVRLYANPWSFSIVATYDTDCDTRSSAATYGWDAYQGDGSNPGEPEDVAGLLRLGQGVFEWSYPGEGVDAPYEWTCSTAALSGDRIYMGGGHASPEVYCVRDSSGTPVLQWALDLPNSQPLYGVPSSPAVADGLVFIGLTRGGVARKSAWLYCLDADTGAVYWSQSLGLGEVFSSPAIYDGRIYIGGPSNRLYCFGNPARVDVAQRRSNPTLAIPDRARGGTSLLLTRPDGRIPQLELFDLAGRRVLTARPGVYFTQDGRRVLIVR